MERLSSQGDTRLALVVFQTWGTFEDAVFWDVTHRDSTAKESFAGEFYFEEAEVKEVYLVDEMTSEESSRLIGFLERLSPALDQGAHQIPTHAPLLCSLVPDLCEAICREPEQQCSVLDVPLPVVREAWCREQHTEFFDPIQGNGYISSKTPSIHGGAVVS